VTYPLTGTDMPTADQRTKGLSRNVWVLSATSFLTDISSEMIQNVLPLFLSNVLGVGTATIGLIEGVAASTASFLKVYFGALSDRLRLRKRFVAGGYALSAIAKAGFYFANSWGVVAGVRWAERTGKGMRTAPRDAMLADSVEPGRRGLAFGLHRGADTGGAVLGLLIAIAVVSAIQKNAGLLDEHTFRVLVMIALIPAVLAVITVTLWAKDVKGKTSESRARISFRGLGKRFGVFLAISALFDLGNFSDAFLVLRAQERGLGVVDVLWTLFAFNLVYAIISTPAGSLSDRFNRKVVIGTGWVLYAAIYLGFALAETPTHIVVLYMLYGAHYGLVVGTGKAFVADLVDPASRGTAYGAYHATLGIIDLPASLIAGVLWQGVGGWQGFGPAAPFYFGAGTALLAAVLLWTLVREEADPDGAG
jgi:MFS family permease